MKNGMIRIGMFEAYLERMLIRGLKVAYISYFTRTLQEPVKGTWPACRCYEGSRCFHRSIQTWTGIKRNGGIHESGYCICNGKPNTGDHAG